MQLHKTELNHQEKQVRELYRALRDELDVYLTDFALDDSYNNFRKASKPYPFVEKRELKPRAKVSEEESSLMNSFIVIFTEWAVPDDMKKYIRYFSNNKVTKENLGELSLAGLNLADRFQKQMKYFETSRFKALLKDLLPVDYALLIQRDTSVKHKRRFSLSHFHVRIDWLIDSAAESMAKKLRYVSKDLYEKGEEYSQAIVEKLFEYYSFHHSVSGRRTAALMAAQLLKNQQFLSTIYVSSSESRTLTRISESEISKFALIKLGNSDIEHIEKHPNGDPEFSKRFLVYKRKDHGAARFQVIYAHNEHSKPPADGKLRDLNPDVSWLRIRKQLLLPKSSFPFVRPIQYQTIYDQQDPLS
ncbi:MAG TPA: hypothetical protein ENI77_07150 [Nitrospirae bacterium]|nr:hypothetical protein [Nitrospirota bacterium]